MTDNSTKSQAQALETLRTSRRLILNWKENDDSIRVAIKAMSAILNSVPDARFLVMVQKASQKTTWQKEIETILGKTKTEALKSHITIDCYASLKEHEYSRWEMVVFDEGDRLRSPLRQNIVKSMTASRVLILTANQDDENQMIETLSCTFGEFKTIR